MKAKKTVIGIGYTRVSTDQQHLSPTAQREAIEAWAARNGVTIVSWHFDVAVSGGLPLDKRTVLLEAVQALSDHEAVYLVVAKRDRLARDVMTSAMVERLVARAGGRIISAAGEGTDNDDPSGQLMRTMIDAFAQYERAVIKQRIKTAMAVKRARGERLGGVPYGFCVGEDGKTLLRDDSESALIARVLELRENGLSQRGIVQRLADEGFRSREGTILGKTQVARLLANQKWGMDGVQESDKGEGESARLSCGS